MDALDQVLPSGKAVSVVAPPSNLLGLQEGVIVPYAGGAPISTFWFSYMIPPTLSVSTVKLAGASAVTLILYSPPVGFKGSLDQCRVKIGNEVAAPVWSLDPDGNMTLPFEISVVPPNQTEAGIYSVVAQCQGRFANWKSPTEWALLEYVSVPTVASVKTERTEGCITYSVCTAVVTIRNPPSTVTSSPSTLSVIVTGPAIDAETGHWHEILQISKETMTLRLHLAPALDASAPFSFTIAPTQIVQGLTAGDLTVSGAVPITAPAPAIESVTPCIMSSTGGAIVTIVAAWMPWVEGSTVKFGDVEATGLQVELSDAFSTRVTVQAPPVGFTGSSEVSINSPTQTVKSPFLVTTPGLVAECLRGCVTSMNGQTTAVFEVVGFGTSAISITVAGIPASISNAKAYAGGKLELTLILPAYTPSAAAPFHEVWANVAPASNSLSSALAKIKYRSAPIVLSSTFDPTGTQVDILFDQDTIGTGFVTCSTYFNQPIDQAVIGSSAMCMWSIPSILTIILPSDATLVNGTPAPLHSEPLQPREEAHPALLVPSANPILHSTPSSSSPRCFPDSLRIQRHWHFLSSACAHVADACARFPDAPARFPHQVPGNSLTLSGQKILSRDSASGMADEQVMIIEGPKVVQSPTLTVSGHSEVGGCDKAVIVAQGSGGRGITFEWSSYDSPSVDSHVKAHTESAISIPGRPPQSATLPSLLPACCERGCGNSLFNCRGWLCGIGLAISFFIRTGQASHDPAWTPFPPTQAPSSS